MVKFSIRKCFCPLCLAGAVEVGGSATATGTIASTLPAVTAALSGTVVNPGATTSDG